MRPVDLLEQIHHQLRMGGNGCSMRTASRTLDQILERYIADGITDYQLALFLLTDVLQGRFLGDSFSFGLSRNHADYVQRGPTSGKDALA